MIQHSKRLVRHDSTQGEWSGLKFQQKIKRAKELLPLPELMEQLGDGHRAIPNALCPFHNDHRPSFSVFRGLNGAWYWKCHAGCGAGDEINYLETKLEVSRADAIRKFFELAGVKRQKQGGAQ